MKKLYILSLIALTLAACTPGNLDILGMFYTRSEGADQRFEQSMQYNDQHGYCTIAVPQDDYHVYIASDTHVDFTTLNLDTFVTDYLADATAAPFCLHLGDFINSVGHYDTCYAHLSRIWDGTGDTCFCTVGNHDIYYDQWQVWRSFFQTSSYWFVVQTPAHKDLYICIDTGDGTMGAKQRKWLEALLSEHSQLGYRHIIAFTHTHIFKMDASQGHTSNMALEETYELCDLFSRYGVDLVLQGHSHARNISPFKDVQYVRVDALEDHYYNAFYTIMHVGKEYGWTFVPVGPQDEDKFEVYAPGVPHL